ncbi:MAG: MarR family transcriptional regulator [Clostridia bacterium]|jgi:DNA-binding MarR family transcriptional regulator|nr:MarR family transcriptional regulator [Clostridia bacterium]MBR6299746.1 MarR family transcriptional regulator [Clostridia bacterium]
MERYIGAELRRLSNLSCRYFERQAGKRQTEAITGTNGWIIGYIGRREERGEVVYQHDLESRFGITRSTASKVVSLMAQKGLVEQLSVEGDRRKKQLRLTRKAREVTQMMNEDRRHFEQMLRRGFSTEELEMLFSFLDRLHANLSEKEENEEQEAL